MKRKAEANAIVDAVKARVPTRFLIFMIIGNGVNGG